MSKYTTQPYVTFESDTDMTITPKFTNTGTLEYSIDSENWNSINTGEETSSSKKLYFRGMMDNNSLSLKMDRSLKNRIWSITNGTNVKIKGNLNTLLNYKKPPLKLDVYAFYSIFFNQSSITDISDLTLPATTLEINCYDSMFVGTGITSIPDNFLPATELAGYCYQNMFSACAGLTSLPENLLPATILANYCYQNMFSGCAFLTSIPENFLPATILKDNCYNNMFNNCVSLTYIPSNLLPATELVNDCYYNMFSNCIKLVINLTSSLDYSREFRIPASGTGIAENVASNNMFLNTAGTMIDPDINTIYYTKD